MLNKNRLPRHILAAAVLAVVVAAPVAVHAATFVVVNNDSAGEGFNDPTAAAPVGGNSGTTVGQQRLIAFQYAADIWAGYLASNVTIRVGAQFNPLSCNTNSGVLGSAGPTLIYRDFSGAPVASTWYAVAEGNALHGSDLDNGTSDDISATFNSNIGTAGCLTSSGWYYGLDGNPPSGKFDFVSVLLHELGHGLGFLTFVDLASGSKFSGLNDAFMLNLENHGASPSDYPSMTDAQRVAASISTGNLHWIGSHVRAASGTLSAGTVGDHVRMFAPNPQQPGSSVSHWDTALTPNQVMEPNYTQPLHDPQLELKAFQDIGWNLLAQNFTLTVNKTGSGTVTSSPAGINCGATCNADFASGTSVTLTATPASGWSFTSWGGACSGTGACIVTMNSAQNVSATFTQQSFALSVSKSGSGTVTSSPSGIDCGATCGANYLSGTSVTLTATPASGWSFTSWGGACSGTGACIVTMNSAQNVSATFTQQSFALSVSKSGSGTVTSSPSGIDCGATCGANYLSGTSVTLTATPVSGWSFTSWGGACSGTGACIVTMNSAQNVSATFTQLFTLSVSKFGNGTVTSSPAGINCGATCSADFADGTLVTLTPTPASGWGLAAWGGACSGNSACTVTTNSAKSVSATFVVVTMDAYVSPRTGSDSGLCPVTSPCATLNYALSVSGAGGRITISDGGAVGPVVLTKEISIVGSDPDVPLQIVADPAAQVGCVGALPAGCALTNHGYAVEIAAGVTDTITLKNLKMEAGTNGAGALKFTSGGIVQLSENAYRGNDTATGPIVALYPNNPGTTWRRSISRTAKSLSIIPTTSTPARSR